MTGSAQVIQADARSLPLADDTVDLIVTSPPYFALRSYQDGGEHYSGQLGSEATPAEFVDALLEVTAECVRVLKPSGSLWVNLGDKYSGAQAQNTLARAGDDSAKTWRQTDPKRTGIPNKSLMGIPWRYAIRCIDDLGLILRAEVIWSKPNGLPESVTDRVRRSHEQWFHFTMQPRYFSAVDEIREPQMFTGGDRPHGQWRDSTAGMNHRDTRTAKDDYNPLGKLPGSVWTIPTEPLQVPDHLGVDHFAAFPTEWPRRIIQGWSPSGVCTACGEGRRPIADVEYVDAGGAGEHERRRDGILAGREGHELFGVTNAGPQAMRLGRANASRTITGYACACPTPDAPTRPAVVLDPFGGTGTTALVAKALGRHGISVDMSADYTRLAEWRVNDPDQLAKAARVDKPPRQVDGQLGFDFEETA